MIYKIRRNEIQNQTNSTRKWLNHSKCMILFEYWKSLCQPFTNRFVSGICIEIYFIWFLVGAPNTDIYSLFSFLPSSIFMSPWESNICVDISTYGFGQISSHFFSPVFPWKGISFIPSMRVLGSKIWSNFDLEITRIGIMLSSMDEISITGSVISIRILLATNRLNDMKKKIGDLPHRRG